MRNKFKLGDRVAAYANGRRDIGEVVNIRLPDHFNTHGLIVSFPVSGGTSRIEMFHPKQCRMLTKKKRRRRVWLPKDEETEKWPMIIYLSKDKVDDWINKSPLPGAEDALVEFIEVRKKKK